MRRLEEIIDVVTLRKRNIAMSSFVLLAVGFIIGFVTIKLV